MTPKWPAGFAFCLVLGWGIGAAGLAAAQDRTPRQSDAAPPTAELPPAAITPNAAPRVLTMPPAADAATAAPPRAESSFSPVANPAARFQFVRIGDAVLKLDGDTGAVGFCHARGADWSCQALPEDRVALDQEIGGLRQKVEKLDGGMAALTTGIGTLRGEVGTLKDATGTLRGEIGALKDAVTAMKTELGTLKGETGSVRAGLGALTNEVGVLKLAVFPPPPPPPPPAPEGPSIALRMPTAEDYARARAFAADAVSNAWRKLVAMVAQVQSDVMRKG